MYKDTKWAREIIALQHANGSWGRFHTLSEPKKDPITTEQALRRLEILGYTINDLCIEKAVSYMHGCLTGRDKTPDRREKTHDWDIFTGLMLSAWIRRFTGGDDAANRVASTWAYIVSSAFKSGEYDHGSYLTAYREAFGKTAKGDRLTDFVSFYQVSLLPDTFDEETECRVFDYVMRHGNGIYYLGYGRPPNILPEAFRSKSASRFIAGIELMSGYRRNLPKLRFAADWLLANKGENGKWDMGGDVKDHIYFPLSDSWKDKNARISDCTYRIEKLLLKIMGTGE
jgi:hypothetical protein